MNSHHSKPSAQEAEKILFKLYHLKGKAFRLPGFVDFNFKIVIDGETQYILKISRENSNNKLRFLLQDILIYLEKVSTDLMIPQIISDQNGNFTSEICNGNKKQTVRLLSWVSGRIWNDVNPRLDKLHYSLGETCGKLTRALLNFKHSEAHGKFEWDTANALWTLEHNHLFKKEEKKIISAFQKRFEHNLASYKRLRQSIVHNDANNYNIIVSKELSNPKVISIIDYGDAIYTQIDRKSVV